MSCGSNGNQKLQSEDILNLLYNIGEQQSKTDFVVHRGISCNVCGSNPLTGIRYKCVNCVDFDTCSRCEPICDHDRNHIFLKICIPIPPLANPRAALLAPFYPGNKSLTTKLPWNEVLELRKMSHFDPSEIEYLYEQYKSLCADNAGISREIFNQCLGPLALKKNHLIDQLFRFYDRNADGFIDFGEYIRGLSILTKGTQEEKAKHFFKAYDIDCDNFISKEDLLKVLHAHHEISVELVRDVVKSCEEEMLANYDDSGNRPISAIFNAPIPQRTPLEAQNQQEKCDPSFHQNINNAMVFPAVEAMTQDALLELANTIVKRADTDRDGKISFSEFKNYSLIDPSLMTWFETLGPVF